MHELQDLLTSVLRVLFHDSSVSFAVFGSKPGLILLKSFKEVFLNSSVSVLTLHKCYLSRAGEGGFKIKYCRRNKQRKCSPVEILG